MTRLKGHVPFLLALLTVWGFAGTASAALPAALTLTQIDALNTYVTRVAGCAQLKAASRPACLAQAGATQVIWDRDKDTRYDKRDVELAFAQLWGSQYVCESNGKVLFPQECPSQCSRPVVAECADPDGDGLYAYQESAIQTALAVASTYDIKPCLSAAECSFQQTCSRVDTTGPNGTGAPDGVKDTRSVCVPRACAAGGTCTAFSLTRVAEDDRELIVQVSYDYSPQPARVLDLKVKIPSTGLTLTDSRLLKGPADVAKRLSTQVIDAVGGERFVRLTIYGTNSGVPVPFGPVAELVFAKQASVSGTVGFSANDAHRDSAMAPNPAAARAELRQNSLWSSGGAGGAAMPLGAGASRLLAHYHFDRENDPVDASGVTSLDTLCGVTAGQPPVTVQAGATGTPDTSTCLVSARKKRQLSNARDGVLAFAGYVDGVLDRGARFSSGGDHLELPIFTRTDQATNSWSFWLRPDEYLLSAGVPTEQVVWAHADTTGAHRVSLVLGWVSSGWVLKLRQGTAVAIPDVTIGALPHRLWSMVGLVLSANSAKVYLNGVAPVVITLNAAVGGVLCPATNAQTGGMLVQSEVPGDRIFLGQPTNQLFSIRQMDGFGAGLRPFAFREAGATKPVVDPGRSSSMDPDYSPILDKIAFVSTQAVSVDKTNVQEVWLANADGTGARPITDGFGIPSKGVFVRRPRFSPNGQLLIFESNMFDAELGDNPRRVFRLFSIPLVGGNPQVPVGASTASSLVYTTHARMTPPMTLAWVTQQTTVAQRESWTNLRFLSDTDVLINSTASDQRTLKVYRLKLDVKQDKSVRISTETPPTEPFLRSGLGAPVLLDARGGATNTALVLRETHLTATSSTKSGPYTISGVANTANSTVTLTVKYNPTSAADLGKQDTCWDTNFNFACEASENLDGSVDTSTPPKATCNWRDCGPIEITTLAVSYGALTLASTPVAGPWLAAPANKRVVRLVPNKVPDSPTTNQLPIEVTAPNGGAPIPAGSTSTVLDGTVLATIVLSGTTSTTAGTLRVGTTSAGLEKWVFGAPTSPPCSTPYSSTTTGCHLVALPAIGSTLKASDVVSGAVSPDGTDFGLVAIQSSRPVLLRVKQAAGAVPSTGPTYSVEKLSELPSRVEGLDWEKLEPVRACHWMGARRDLATGRLDMELRGELDDIKVYNYTRSDAAMASEWARGDAWNRKENPAGTVNLASACAVDTDCPIYQRCTSLVAGVKQCEYDACSVTDPCSAGQCAWTPPELGGPTTAGYSCFVECGSDAQCFTKECYNGPCRFCDASACIECRWNPDKEVVPGFRASVLEGCPDDNKFACEAGSCVSECYSFENGQSRYLCTTNEYCQRGRCVAMEWDWTDLAPASLASGGLPTFDNDELMSYLDTTVLSTEHILEISAYGTSDIGFSPQLRVQGKTPAGLSPYGNAWFDLGTLSVDNTLKAEATSRPYRLMTRYPVSEVRFTMVAPPAENPNRASVGYASDPTLCNTPMDFSFDADCAACVARGGFESAPSGAAATCGSACGTVSDCARLPGSRRRLGYSVVLPDPRDTPEYLTATNPSDVYLRTGEPTVIVTDLKINGQLVSVDGSVPAPTVSNRACSYVLGGAAPSATASRTDSVTYAQLNVLKTPYLVLNCPERAVAGATPEAIVAMGLRGKPGRAGGAFQPNASAKELGSGCFYNVDGATVGTYPLCYGFIGAPSFEPMMGSPFIYGSLEIGSLKTFGYEKNQLKRP